MLRLLLALRLVRALEDVKAYQKKRDAARHAALNELARAEFAEGLDDGIPLQPSESDV